MIDIHQDVKVEAFKLLGREAFSEKKYDDAIRYYNSALELTPHAAEIYRERGGVYYAMGDKHHASPHPKFPCAYYSKKHGSCRMPST